MKKTSLFIFLAIASLAFIFTACPYSSTVPLSGATESIDPAIYGKWVKVDEYNDYPKYYVFSKIDGKKLRIEQYEYNATDSLYTISGTYAAHFTTIGDVKYVNMLQDGTYYFYRLEFTNPSEFALYEVTDNIDEVFDKSTDLYSFFNANKGLSFFYNKDEETYILSKE
ncbi:MAG TPA: hypothetical protein PLP11_10520 [Bacteroidales bacterium]|nr:hypothetical protein [Bacteroidales bacterium]